MKLRHAASGVLLLGVAACGTDARLRRDPAGNFVFAPVRNQIGAESSLGPPVFDAGVTAPARGFVVVQSSFGYTTTYVFDAGTGVFSGVWDDPAVPGATTPPPEIHSFQLPADERNAFIRMINMAWGPRRPAPGPATAHEVTAVVWLLDGNQYKALDGYRIGQVINASAVAVAAKHKVARDDFATNVPLSKGKSEPAVGATGPAHAPVSSGQPPNAMNAASPAPGK